jgi:hypothetical protein
MRIKRWGFSLAELLVAMFVMVVGIAGVTSAIYWGMQKTDSGKYVTQASDLARIITETFVARGEIAEAAVGSPAWPDNSSKIFDDPADRRPVFDEPFQDLSVVGTGITAYDSVIEQRDITKYTRNIRVERLAPPGTLTGPPTNQSGYTASLARLIVKVYWNEKGHERHVTLETIIPHGVE